jgi:hypothetical protein
MKPILRIVKGTASPDEWYCLERWSWWRLRWHCICGSHTLEHLQEYKKRLLNYPEVVG